MRFLWSFSLPTSLSAVLVAAIALVAIPNSAARADWHGGGGGGGHGRGGGWHGGGDGDRDGEGDRGGGWGWHGGTWSCCWRGGVFVGVAPFYVPPPVYYLPPPVYYPPPPVYYPTPYTYGY